jgi:hypothetical protein
MATTPFTLHTSGWRMGEWLCSKPWSDQGTVLSVFTTVNSTTSSQGVEHLQLMIVNSSAMNLRWIASCARVGTIVKYESTKEHVAERFTTLKFWRNIPYLQSKHGVNWICNSMERLHTWKYLHLHHVPSTQTQTKPIKSMNLGDRFHLFHSTWQQV